MKQSRYNIWVERPSAYFVYNGVSGALLRVPTPQYSALQAFIETGDSTGCPAKLIERMALGQMLIPDDADELELLAERYTSSRYDKSRFSLTIVTSLGCNFDCPYCFEAKHPSIIDKNVEESIISILDDQLPTISSFSVAWFGGEPLVGKKSLFALSNTFIERCESADVTYDADIATNGYLLDHETCVQLHERKVRRAQICLDGPPEFHDKMRPLVNGKGTFQRIVANLHHAVQYFDVTIRMNVDAGNFGVAESLMDILVEEGLSGKLGIYPGQIIAVDDGAPSPSTTYKSRCFTNPEFAQAELKFRAMAAERGFGSPSIPRPARAPCTAVRSNELVIGSKGELYKCWNSVGNSKEVIGHANDYRNVNGRLHKWLKYDPFSNPDCRSCIALPTCMGGCAHHAMDPIQYENRCGTFRHTYREQISTFVDAAESQSVSGPAHRTVATGF